MLFRALFSHHKINKTAVSCPEVDIVTNRLKFSYNRSLISLNEEDVLVSAHTLCVAMFGSVSGFVATKCIYDFVPVQVFGFNVLKSFVEVTIAVYIHGCFVQQILTSIEV